MIAGMLEIAGAVGWRTRVLLSRVLRRLGLQEDSYLVVLAVFIGVVAALAACGFHEFIGFVRDELFASRNPGFLYGRGLWLLILWPCAGGLAVGLFGHLRGTGGQGVPEIIESVIRRQGFMSPTITVEKIVTAGITIGSGGSAGAEGPIVQIGAGIASFIGWIFQVARHHMPILIGCGCAAGISAIFNAPIGGVLFTIEVILQDFSIRAFTPLVLASVVANVATQTIYHDLLKTEYNAIFAMTPFTTVQGVAWRELPTFLLLGIACGLCAIALVRLLLYLEERTPRLPLPMFCKPALGGALVGLLGVLYVVILGWAVVGDLKPISFEAYPMPGFFGDGYGVIRRFLDPAFYVSRPQTVIWALLATLLVLKILATSLTLGSGGSGGVIAPSLFVGAATGGMVAFGLQHVAVFSTINPALYALVGMGAVLGAVVHAPLAAILIVVELTQDYHIILPAMLCCISALGMARILYPESVYTYTLLKRGIRLGRSGETIALRQASLEQVGLEPVVIASAESPFTQLLASMGENVGDAIILDEKGQYVGMVMRQSIEQALLNPASMPLLLAGELMQQGLPVLATDDDLARAVAAFAQCEADSLPVTLAGGTPGHVVGMISRRRLMQKYQSLLSQK